MISHLWQSTWFAIAAWALTILLRGYRARIRYWIWLAASLKFLVPFSLLIGIGSRVASRAPAPIAPRPVAAAVQRVLVLDLPFTATPPPSSVWPLILSALWLAGSAVVAFGWWREWRRVRGAPVEPGVVGLWRQSLILPARIEERLTAEELAAIVAHERCHMRCRDNLTAALHMLVEAVFWFHPLVWWIEARLIDERERACDEEVLRAGSEPQVYASGIVKVCELYLESPLVCAAGVTGSDLKRRIESIVHWRGVRRLGAVQVGLLGLASALVVALPLLIGADRPAFEVASVKPFQAGNGPEVTRKVDVAPDSVSMHRQSLRDIIEWAYGSNNANEVAGPNWIDSTDYDIRAKAPGPASVAQLRLMLQTLLAERFQLALHTETRVLPVYTLTAPSGASKLHPVDLPSRRGMIMRFNDNIAEFELVSDMARFGEAVSMFTARRVVDQTGLTGVYQITLRVEMEPGSLEQIKPNQPFAGFGPTSAIFKAVEPLGLKLESRKAPVQVYVIDHVARPAAN